METKHDADLREAFGLEQLPATAMPGQSYTGAPFVQVTTARTQVEPGERLPLTPLAPEVSAKPAVSVRPRRSTTARAEIAPSPVGRSVYEAILPAQTSDFEYKVEAGQATYPASAPQTVATVTVADQPGSSSASPGTLKRRKVT